MDHIFIVIGKVATVAAALAGVLFLAAWIHEDVTVKNWNKEDGLPLD